MEQRGKIVTIKLKNPITFNGAKISKAIIEIDHINFGINPKTKTLNTTPRTKFTVKNIEKFIYLLDGEMLTPERYISTRCIFELRICCPIEGIFCGKEFVMVIETDYRIPDQILTVTLFPNW